MCGRLALTSSPELCRAFFGYFEQPNFPPRYNIAPTQAVPILTLKRLPMGGHQRHFTLVRWGFLPAFVKDPKDVVSPGDKVSARVLKIDRERNQISLSMKSEGSERRPSPEAGRSAYGQSSSHQRRPEQQRTPQAANLAPSSLADSPFAKLAQMIQNKK